MNFGLFNRPFVLLKLHSDSRVPCLFNEVPECNRIQIYNILGVQKRKQGRCAQVWPKLHTYTKHELFHPVLRT